MNRFVSFWNSRVVKTWIARGYAMGTNHSFQAFLIKLWPNVLPGNCKGQKAALYNIIKTWPKVLYDNSTFVYWVEFLISCLMPLEHSTVAHYFLRGYFYLEMMVKSLINWSWTQTPACSSKDTKLYLVSWNCIVLFSKVFIRAQVFKSSACDIFETGRPSTKTYSTQAP